MSITSESSYVVRRENAILPPERWCRNGNACLWGNCKFRHERCSHYDAWVKSGKSGRPLCRSFQTDPCSNKSPENGGCRYDHRDRNTLIEFVKYLPCSTDEVLWESFVDKGIREAANDVFIVSDMKDHDIDLLLRSLENEDIEWEWCGKDYIHILF